MRVGHRLLAQLAFDEHQVHPGVERAGTEQRVRGDEVVEAVALHVPERVGGQCRFKLEDPGGAAAAQQVVHQRVVERKRRHVGRPAGADGDHLHRVVNDGERLEAEEVHLEHPDLLERPHVVLTDDRIFAIGRPRAPAGSRAHRDVLGQGARRDHDAGGMH